MKSLVLFVLVLLCTRYESSPRRPLRSIRPVLRRTPVKLIAPRRLRLIAPVPVPYRHPVRRRK